METFNLKEYKGKNHNDLSKFKRFIQYLDCSDDELSPKLFESLTKDDLLNTLWNYIDSDKPTSRNTGDNYITAIENFFEYLSEKYSIHTIYQDARGEWKHFRDEASEIINEFLKESKSKGIISEDDFEELNNEIAIYLKRWDVTQKNRFMRFVSIISTKLAMNYGTPNKIAVNLKLKDLNLDDETLNICGIPVPIDDELKYLFETYLKLRENIVQSNPETKNWLFVRIDGKPYLDKAGTADNQTFYGIMEKVFGTGRPVAELCNRRKIQMLKSGLDITAVVKLTDSSSEELQKLVQFMNETYDDDENIRITKFFKDTQNKKIESNIKKIGYSICSYCGKSFPAISARWMLVEFSGDEDKHLACKNCEAIKNGQREPLY